MSVQPGMPEHRGLADRIKTLEAQVARINRARKLQSASIGSGGLAIKDGGTIRLVDDSGDTVAELDKDSQTFFDNAGNPLTVLNGSGLTVGDDVVIDSDGLKITDVLQEANWIDEQFEFDTTPTLSTSFADLVSVTISPPSWVETLSVLAYGAAHASQSTLDVNQLSAFIRIDGTDGPIFSTVNEGYSIATNTLNEQAVPVVFSRTITSPAASLSVAVRASVFDDSPSVGGSAGVTVLAVGRLSS